jgi:hypothetical protein
MRIQTIKSIVPKRGRELLAMNTTENLGRTPWIVNKFKPKGGVIKPISARTTKVTPHQMGSYPRFVKTGMTNGSVKSIMAMESKNIPKIR